MSEKTWRNINPHFRVDHDTVYTFADVERWDGDTRISREHYYSNPLCRTLENVDDVVAKLHGYSDELHKLLEKPCGILVNLINNGSDIAVRIYQHERRGLHLVYCDPALGFVPSWLRKVLNDWVWDDAASDEEAFSGKRKNRSGKRAAEDPIPDVATVAGDELAPGMSDIKTRIAALKGVFALATGQYDDVTEADIQATTDAGYANPEVMVGVKDATWLMVEKHRDKAWNEGYVKGYADKVKTLDADGKDAALRIEEATRAKFERDLDKWMSILKAGIMGHQPEAYVVMDAAIDELVARRNADHVVKPATGSSAYAHKEAMKGLTLRRHRAETILAELQAAEKLDELYSAQAAASADLLREYARSLA